MYHRPPLLKNHYYLYFFTNSLNFAFPGPFQIILAIYFLWQEVGPSVLAGVAVMALLVPINSVIATKTRALQVSGKILSTF